MKTVSFRTSISPQGLAFMCNAGLCPIFKDAFFCPMPKDIAGDCESVQPRHWEAVMEDVEEGADEDEN